VTLDRILAKEEQLEVFKSVELEKRKTLAVDLFLDNLESEFAKVQDDSINSLDYLIDLIPNPNIALDIYYRALNSKDDERKLKVLGSLTAILKKVSDPKKAYDMYMEALSVPARDVISINMVSYAYSKIEEVMEIINDPELVLDLYYKGLKSYDHKSVEATAGSIGKVAKVIKDPKKIVELYLEGIKSNVKEIRRGTVESLDEIADVITDYDTIFSLYQEGLKSDYEDVQRLSPMNFSAVAKVAKDSELVFNIFRDGLNNENLGGRLLHGLEKVIEHVTPGIALRMYEEGMSSSLGSIRRFTVDKLGEVAKVIDDSEVLFRLSSSDSKPS